MKILITGASGGLGSVLAVLALERGHQVYAAGRSREKVEKALESVRTKGYQGYRELRKSRALRILPLDVTSEADAKACARTVQEDGGALDGLVNCAAIMIEREKTLEDLDLDRVVESFQVYTVGPMRMVQHLSLIHILTEYPICFIIVTWRIRQHKDIYYIGKSGTGVNYHI